MANRAFQDYASSGELLALYIGGIQPEHKVLTSIGVTNAITAPKSEVLFTPLVSAPSEVEGLVFYDQASHSLSYYTDISRVTVNIGQEMVRRVINLTGADIPDGTPLRHDGVDITSGKVRVTGAIANTFQNATLLGVATHIIADGTEGWITFGGDVHDLDMALLSDGTSTIITGAPVYVSAITAGKITMNPPDIASQIGGFLSGSEGGGAISAMAVKMESNINLPAVLAYMRGGSIVGTVLDSTFRDVANYTEHGNVVLPYDETTGEITISSSGIYTVAINLTALFDAIGISEETITLRINGSITGNNDIPITIPRNVSAASAFPSISFSATVGEVIKIQLACLTTTLTNVSFALMSFEIESKQIR